jgi:hypothetical protein
MDLLSIAKSYRYLRAALYAHLLNDSLLLIFYLLGGGGVAFFSVAK